MDGTLIVRRGRYSWIFRGVRAQSGMAYAKVQSGNGSKRVAENLASDPIAAEISAGTRLPKNVEAHYDSPQ